MRTSTCVLVILLSLVIAMPRVQAQASHTASQSAIDAALQAHESSADADRADLLRVLANPDVKAVADKGGVVGVYFMPFLTLDSHPKGEDLLRHIEHVANVAGEDHVGIGTDNGPLPQVVDAESTKKLNEWAAARMKAGIAAPGEGLNVWPMVADYNSIDRYRRVASDLQKRGWSEARLEKLMGGNFLRVYREAWGG